METKSKELLLLYSKNKKPKTKWGLVHVIKKITVTGEEKTLAMVYGEKLSKELLQKCKEAQT